MATLTTLHKSLKTMMNTMESFHRNLYDFLNDKENPELDAENFNKLAEFAKAFDNDASVLVARLSRLEPIFKSKASKDIGITGDEDTLSPNIPFNSPNIPKFEQNPKKKVAKTLYEVPPTEKKKRLESGLQKAKELLKQGKITREQFEKLYKRYEEEKASLMEFKNIINKRFKNINEQNDREAAVNDLIAKRKEYADKAEDWSRTRQALRRYFGKMPEEEYREEDRKLRAELEELKKMRNELELKRKQIFGMEDDKEKLKSLQKQILSMNVQKKKGENFPKGEYENLLNQYYQLKSEIEKQSR